MRNSPWLGAPGIVTEMFKQVCFFRKRPDMTMEEFIDYYENQHSRLSERLGRSPSIPNAVRYVRRYLTPELNPVTGEVIDPGYHCIMEIWWNSRRTSRTRSESSQTRSACRHQGRRGSAVRDAQQPDVLGGGVRLADGSER